MVKNESNSGQNSNNQSTGNSSQGGRIPNVPQQDRTRIEKGESSDKSKK